ncbi:MAG: hypothetical protein ACK5Y6_07765 [Pseudomonadota bacterium]
MNDSNQVGGRDGQGSSINPFAVAAGLIRNDLKILLPLFLFLSIAAVVDSATFAQSRQIRFAVVALDKLLQVAAVTFIAWRWGGRLRASGAKGVGYGTLFMRIAVVSIAASIVLTTPFLGLIAFGDMAQGVLFLILAVIGLIWCLRVFFYFASTGILGVGLAQGMISATTISRNRPTASLRSLVSPLAVTLLLTALFTIPNPDGRSSFWITLASASESVFWILSTYTALGFALTLFSDAEWRAAHLDPYRTERLRTLEAQGGRSLARMLSPGFGLYIAGVALFFVIGTTMRQLYQPPAARVEVKQVQFSDYQIKVTLLVEDREYLFRGFQPTAFSIASKTGFKVIDRVVSVSLDNDTKGFAPGISSTDGAPRTVYLTFATSKTEAALRGLDNLWLWYKLHPLMQVPMG